MTQRRSLPRVHRRLPVSLGGKLPALTADVSPEGFKVELPQVFVPGSLVHGFVLDGGKEVPFQGEVSWAQPGNPMASVMSEMGVRFLSPSPALVRVVGSKRKTKK